MIISLCLIFLLQMFLQPTLSLYLISIYYVHKHSASEKENENDSAVGQCNGPSVGNKVSPENDEKPTRPPLTQQGNLFPNNEVKKDIQVKQVDKMSMMDQLAQELGEHIFMSRGKAYWVVLTQLNL